MIQEIGVLKTPKVMAEVKINIKWINKSNLKEVAQAGLIIIRGEEKEAQEIMSEAAVADNTKEAE